MKKILLLAIACFLNSPLKADDVFTGNEILRTGPIAFNQDIDIGKNKVTSVQVVAADGTPASHTVNDGIKSTANITILSTTSLLTNTITIGAVTITFGTEIATGPVTGNTVVIVATSAAAALRTSFGGVIDFSTGVVSGNSVVTATATNVGVYVPFVSATSTNTVWSFPFMNGGTDPDITVSNDSIRKVQHGFDTGLRVWVSTLTGTIPTGLTMGSTYFAVKLNSDVYQLATSSMNAVAGTVVDITRLIGSSTINATPLALVLVSGAASNTGFKWQVSNDQTNYNDISVSSFTYVSSTSTIVDLGALAYRWLRMVYVGPTSGALSIKAAVNARR